MTNTNPKNETDNLEKEKTAPENFYNAWEGAGEEEKKILYSFAHDSYTRELSLLWERTQFFWTLNALAIGGLGFITNSGKSIEYSDYSLVLSTFGLITSLSWALINRGSKYWYEHWEERLKLNDRFELWMKPYRNHSYQSPGHWWVARFSPSKVLIAISDVIFLFWVVITIVIVTELEFKRWIYLLMAMIAVVYVFWSAVYHPDEN